MPEVQDDVRAVVLLNIPRLSGQPIGIPCGVIQLFLRNELEMFVLVKEFVSPRHPEQGTAVETRIAPVAPMVGPRLKYNRSACDDK